MGEMYVLATALIMASALIGAMLVVAIMVLGAFYMVMGGPIPFAKPPVAVKKQENNQGQEQRLSIHEAIRAIEQGKLRIK